MRIVYRQTIPPSCIYSFQIVSIFLMSNVPKLLKKREAEKKLPVKLLVLSQIAIIAYLGVFLFSKFSSAGVNDFSKAMETMNIENPFQKDSSNTPKVAGASIERASIESPIPPKIIIKIRDRAQILNTNEFGFKVVEVEVDTSPQLSRKEQLITDVKTTVKKLLKRDVVDPIVLQRYLEFDQAKLEYWFLTHYGDMQTDKKIDSAISFEEDTNKVIGCNQGSPALRLPLNAIFQDLKTASDVPDRIEYDLEESVLTEDEELINRVCTKIDDLVSKVNVIEIEEFDDASKNKEYTFISKEVLHDVFNFRLEDNELIFEVNDEQKLRDELKQLKVLVDVEVKNNKYVTKGENLYILGNHESGRYLNVDETINAFNEQSVELEGFKYFPFVFDETEEEAEITDLNVERFPLMIGTAQVKVPLDPLEQTGSVRRIVSRMNATIVEPESEFSFIDNLGTVSESDAEKYFYAPVTFHDENTRYAYFESMSFVSTAFYRAAVNTGFPITQRTSRVKAPVEAYFGDNYDLQSFATFISSSEQPEITHDIIHLSEEEIQGEITKTSFEEDLKFFNDSDQRILIIINDSIKGDGQFYLDVEIYAEEEFTDREVKLKNFDKIPFTDGDFTGYVERFTQETIKGEEEFITKYYE